MTDMTAPVGQERGEDMQTRIGRLLDEVEATPDGQPDAVPEQTAPVSAPAAGNPLGGLLSNPEILTALPQLMGALGPLMKNSGASHGGAPGSPARKPPPARHPALLRALKPYLSPERRQAAETALELLNIWEALAGMGLSLPSLAGSRPTGGGEA